MPPHATPSEFNPTARNAPEHLATWSSVACSDFLVRGQIEPGLLAAWGKVCLGRVQKALEAVKADFVGWDDPEYYVGNPVDWAVAGLVARENVLFIGDPGTAKSMLSRRLFKALGLNEAQPDSTLLDMPLDSYEDWQRRAERERQQQKFFSYLLTEFTQPEEVFGPVHLEFLKKGRLVRVNWSFATGPGVRGVFLDEVMKANSSIANTLLTLLEERTYSNWGTTQKADLALVLAASNELPGSDGHTTMTASSTFESMHAFVDRFPVRLWIPRPSHQPPKEGEPSALNKAAQRALAHEAGRFGAAPATLSQVHACVNDVLLLGRLCAQDWLADGDGTFFRGVADFRARRAKLDNELAAASERNRGTLNPAPDWTMTARKARATHKVAFAHALVTRGEVTKKGPSVALNREDLGSYDLIWDDPGKRQELHQIVVS